MLIGVKSLQKIIENGMESLDGLYGLSCPPSPSGHIYFFWSGVATPGKLRDAVKRKTVTNATTVYGPTVSAASFHAYLFNWATTTT